jgi:hypothetical protein
MPRLTNPQRTILTAAVKRPGGVVLPLPKSIKNHGVTLRALRKKGLVAENCGRRKILAITEAGSRAIRVGSDPKSIGRTQVKLSRQIMRNEEAKHATGDSHICRGASLQRRQSITKQALLIELLSRKNGATISEAVEATGWQPHSIRGAISGTLKKKLGLDVISQKVHGGNRVYQIVDRS